ncbi:Rne/Rng family ribonuclease [uncultured Tessaracoccus sp.]|uniref:Rne/Rng family ribonuclease n=1 Tax=uncultured Tessaracoccus sp. TaxID=905023 RepID=UPI0025EB09C6|nr:Rne/Rng family ribonuclease [uncultured Tessaracoccus sp.]
MTDAVEPEAREHTEPARPRRRRAASRPAGAPSRAEGSTPAVTTTVADAAVATVASSDDAEPARPTRRRATRRSAAPTADAEVVVTGPAPEPEPKDARAEGDEPEARKRGKSEKPKGKKQTKADEPKGKKQTKADEPKGKKKAKSDEPKGSKAKSDEPEKAARRSRSRRKEEPEQPVEDAPKADAEEEKAETDEPKGDALEAKLAEAEKVAEARRAVVENPFMSDEDREQQLAALAGAIAAGDDEDADDDDDEDDEDESDDNDDDSDEDSEDEAEERPTRRRRRRGGRRRRRGSRGGGGGDRSDQQDGDERESGKDDKDSKDDKDEKSEKSGDDSGREEGGSRRRRRRRRRGGGRSEADDEVTGIEGSTRIEAKRQRRRESRAAGRRRAPILSEAEFLVRREAVDRKLVVRQSEDYTQLAVLEDDVLVEHYVDRPSASSLIGNIYLGKIQNVLPSMEAAFIDIGRGRNAVLYAGEVDWESFGVNGEDRKVENVLKSGQTIVVQVTKDPVGQKGARLTHHISLPGRYIVYSPGGHLSGISRKLPDSERSRLRSVLNEHIQSNESVIVRTAAEGATEEDLVRDINRLKAQWEVIEKRAKKGGAPHPLYTEPDLTLRIIRDLFTEDFKEIQVQGDGGQEDAFDTIAAYVGHVAPNLLERVVRYEVGDDGKDVFARNRIDEQIAKALDRKVFLPSGGSLVIDRTEAMTVIDVNTGRFTGSGGNLEATVTSNNLEAAEEVVRQLRLRDIGGIIVVDFIDMVLPSNRELLLRRLVECLGRDRTRHQVAEVTSLGLVQMTRKKIGTGLAEAFTQECEHCHGQGYHKSSEPTDTQAPADGGERSGRRRRRR